jgi:hypothetical protein
VGIGPFTKTPRYTSLSSPRDPSPVIEANHNLMFDYIYSFHRSDFPVEHFFVVVILGQDELVAKLESP